jgi:hypothetical protein
VFFAGRLHQVGTRPQFGLGGAIGFVHERAGDDHDFQRMAVVVQGVDLAAVEFHQHAIGAAFHPVAP